MQTAIDQTTTKNFSLSTKSKNTWKKTVKLIPSGVQTYSKAPSKFVEGVYPIYAESAKGCYLYDEEGNGWIDYPLGLGAITLGYGHPFVNRAIEDQLKRGVIFTLPSEQETILAEILKQFVPSCEMVRFLKTGSEAVNAAIRIARAFTGKSHIGFCSSGYHGWHDWFTVGTPKSSGIPVPIAQYVHKFNFNDLESVKSLIRKHGPHMAALVLEPYIFEEPKGNFLNELIKIAHANEILVIFDEVVTGFRTPRMTAQRYFKATPDLCTLGKGMANGLPISCVCGRADIMKTIEQDCFVSSTFGGDLLGISAAIATTKLLADTNGPEHMQGIGAYLQDGFNEIARALDIFPAVECRGLPTRTMFMFPTEVHKSLFWQECVLSGVLFGYAQFISCSHTYREVDYTLAVVRDALKKVKEHWANPLSALRGKPAEAVFRLVVDNQGKKK